MKAVSSRCSPSTSRARSMSISLRDGAILRGAAAVLVTGLVEVGQVHDDELRVARLRDAQGVVDERGR